MRRVFLLPMTCIAATLVAGCDLKEVYPTAAPAVGGVRFINAVPDSGGAYGFDMRFVDELESNAHFRQGFRNAPATTSGVTAATGVQYKPTAAGQRRFRIFLSDTIQSAASTVIADTTVTIVAGSNYSAILMGYARTGSTPSMRLLFIEENVADPGANVAVRVINTTGSAIDVRQYPVTSPATPLPGAPTWANVPAMSVSTYVTAAPNQIRFNVQPAGGGATLFAEALTLVGQAAFSTAGPTGRLDIEALPGTTVAGSAVTYIVFPPSVAGSRAASFTTAGGVSVWDRRPPLIP